MDKKIKDSDFNHMIEEFEIKHKTDYDVPLELSQRVDTTLKGLRRKPRWYRYPIAIAASLFLILFSASNLSPGFRAFASTIPGLDVAVEWLIIDDQGIQKAVENGYPDLGPIVVKKDGYTVKFENVFVDDTRIRLTVRLVGENVTEDTHLSISCPDIGTSSVIYENMHWSDEAAAWEADIKPASIDDFVRYLKNHDRLLLHAKIVNKEETISEIGDIAIPYESEDILYSNHYTIGQRFSTEHGDITFESITISPTRTVVNINYGEKNGYYTNGLTDLQLIDDTGHVYEQDSLSIGSGSVQLFFNDSIYFRPDVKRLSIQYSGYTMAKVDGKRFTLPLNMDEPVVIDYMGETITIKSVSWNNDTLNIRADYTNPDVLRIQEIAPLIDTSSSGCGSYTDDDGTEKLFCNYDGIERLNAYDVEIMYPRYKIDMPRKVDIINLN